MNKDQILFILTLWGAVLSTVLGVITFITFRKGSRVKLGIIGTVDEPFDHLRISVCNLGSRPGTVTAYSIGIGVSPNTQVQILKRQLNTEKKLAESDIWTTTIDTPTILSARN